LFINITFSLRTKYNYHILILNLYYCNSFTSTTVKYHGVVVDGTLRVVILAVVVTGSSSSGIRVVVVVVVFVVVVILKLYKWGWVRV